MSTILSRWTAKLGAREALLNRSERSVNYWARRAGSRHGHQMLEAAKARRALRERQVAEARGVITRHSSVSTVSDEGVALVAGFEGFVARPYRDAVGVLTQGYGETQGITPNGAAWTRAYAATRLRTRLNRDYLAPVLAAAQRSGVELRQNEADALASLVYNCGVGILASSASMGAALASKDRARIAAAFLRYVYAGGHVLPGLVNRRRAERALFLRP